ncbi:uncharacterized protein LOC126372652 [Pectinophora gossypiella]|uniref:uncharacterized protein LOC126372652 n=1 Tax=Pectinophora gossypiella TaxID=13191 RepID=UPI00214EC8F0|nr:uncharacterized protein LOC126372652 [Pectinophora gossypiella]
MFAFLQYNKQVVTLNTKLSKIFSRQNISRAIVLTVVVLVLPMILGLLLLALLYKVMCAMIIIRKDKNFVGFLDSFDVFWSLEDDTSKSIINVLGIIESNSSQAVAKDIKKKLEQAILNDTTGKIFYRRNEKYGFYYWSRHNFVDMDQYVEVIELPNKCDDNLNVIDLENLMTDLQEDSLPYEDEGLFKILITRQRISNHNNLKGNYGIIFRIHHSVGDGTALIEFLCQTLADETNDCLVNMFSMPEAYRNPSSPKNLVDMMQTLLEIPICFVDGILRKPDENPLHSKSLNGRTVFKWTESDENLLTMVKEIKENVARTCFSEILIAALSRGLRNSFQQTEGKVPEDVAVVLPVRFPKTSTIGDDPILKNDFSVTILDVPVEDKDNLYEIKERCNLLRRSADPLTNYYFLKLICSVFPASILQPMLYSRQATMVLSNLPGPPRLTICGGNVLQSLVFFVPHKGTTGLGVTALCYGGVLRFAASADQALISTSDRLSPILDGMVEEIRRLHTKYANKRHI